MKKLLVALIAGAFALGSVAALADDKTPGAPVDQAKLKAEREAKKAEQAKMTPEEKKAAKKAKSAERQKELGATEKAGQEGGASPQSQAAQGAKEAKESKAQPKSLATKEEKQKALNEKWKPERDAIHDRQVDQINAMLREDQRPLYASFRAERDRQRRLHDQQRKK